MEAAKVAKMMKVVMAAALFAALFVGSCIFQNNPLGPNRSPSIQSYAPDSISFTLVAPDSCLFSIKAVDPDGDQIRYAFKSGDSLLGTGDSWKFYARAPRTFDIRAEAWDGSSRASHDWHVKVVKKDNLPPKIIFRQPDQDDVACAVGDTLEFVFSAQDDHIESIEYSYKLGSRLISSGSSHLIYRFMDRGDFLLHGIAWDGQYGDTVSWNVSVTGYPDTTKPAAIMDLTGGPGDIDGTVSLEWTAPGDDGNVGKAASYIVRTSTYPIVTEHDWEDAEGKVGEPVPSPAGTREHMTIWNLGSGSYVYVMMRALDDFFNESPLGNCARVLVRGIDVGGYTRNAATNEPIEGIILSSSYQRDSSAADGSYLLENVPSFASLVTAKDEEVSGQLGNYYDVVMPIGKIMQHVHMDFLMIPVFGLVSVVDPDLYQGRFLAFFEYITWTDAAADHGGLTVFKGWNHWPVSVYNPPYVYHGLDLQAAASGAMADWESSTGLDLFVEVGQVDNADACIMYDTTVVNSHQVETTAHNVDGTPAHRNILIYPLNTQVPMSRFSHKVFAHELGHVLGLEHSCNEGHLMAVAPDAEHPTLDEIRAVQIIYHMPCIYDYARVLEE